MMLMPLGMYNRSIAEQARKEALAKSTVKIIGADVMATKKLITAIKMYPMLVSLFTFGYYYILSN